MKKNKKKREPKKPMNDDLTNPIEIKVVNSDKVDMYFKISNRGLKMLKAGNSLKKTFVTDGKRCTMTFMHTDVYDDRFKDNVDEEVRVINEAKMRRDANAQNDVEATTVGE